MDASILLPGCFTPLTTRGSRRVLRRPRAGLASLGPSSLRLEVEEKSPAAVAFQRKDKDPELEEEQEGSGAGGRGGGGGKGKNNNRKKTGGGSESGGGQGGGGDPCNLDAYYRRMLRADPANPLILRNYAKFLSEVEGDFASAQRFFGTAAAVAPEDGELLASYGKFLWDVHGDGEAAETYFLRAVEASPNDWADNFGSGRVNSRFGWFKVDLFTNVPLTEALPIIVQPSAWFLCVLSVGSGGKSAQRGALICFGHEKDGSRCLYKKRSQRPFMGNDICDLITKVKNFAISLAHHSHPLED